MSHGPGLTVAQWHEMQGGGAGPLARELLDGEAVTRGPMSARHADCVVRLHRLIEVAVGAAAVVRMHQPLILDERSEPRPDVSVLEQPATAGAAPALLVVEVADTSHDLVYSRGRKAAYYARCAIADCWVVDLAAGQVLVHSSPASGGYRDIRNLRGDAEASATSLPGVSLAVAEILGPPPAATA